MKSLVLISEEMNNMENLKKINFPRPKYPQKDVLLSYSAVRPCFYPFMIVFVTIATFTSSDPYSNSDL